MKKLKKSLLVCFILFTLGVLLLYGLSYHIQSSTDSKVFRAATEVPEVFTVIVLGAGVRSNGDLSTMLEDRITKALELYNTGKVKRFLLSGDNGTKYYNEPKAMKEYLVNKGVPEDIIYLDYAGFDTYNSMYRAHAIFNVKDAVVVTQEFHIARTIYIAQELGLNYYGLSGDQHVYKFESYNKRRELLANVKAFGELLIHREPKFLGDKIPIEGPPQSFYMTN